MTRELFWATGRQLRGSKAKAEAANDLLRYTGLLSGLFWNPADLLLAQSAAAHTRIGLSKSDCWGPLDLLTAHGTLLFSSIVLLLGSKSWSPLDVLAGHISILRVANNPYRNCLDSKPLGACILSNLTIDQKLETLGIQRKCYGSTCPGRSYSQAKRAGCQQSFQNGLSQNAEGLRIARDGLCGGARATRGGEILKGVGILDVQLQGAGKNLRSSWL